jgi:hypothetical protein
LIYQGTTADTSLKPKRSQAKKMTRTEVRFEVEANELSVIDGYCSGTGKCRTEVIRLILDEWSKNQLHISTLICRVAGVNPAALDTNRNEGK